jgi:hypothetical protein
MTAQIAVTTEFLETGGAGADIVINKPGGTASGDLLLMHSVVFFSPTGVASGAITGFTDDVATYGTTEQKGRVQHRIVDGSEGATFTSSVGSSNYTDAIMLRIIGADQTTPIDGTPATASGTATNANAPAYSTSVDGCIAILTITGPGVMPTDPGDHWLLVEQYGSPVGSSACYVKWMPVAGSTGTQNLNWTTSGQYTMAVTAIRPATVTGIDMVNGNVGTPSQTQTSQTASPIDMAAAGSITVGNYLIMRISCNNTGSAGASALSSITDPRSNSWTISQITQDPGAADAGITCAIAYAKVANAYTNGDDITVNFSPAVTSKAMIIEEWSGIHATVPVAVAATTQTTATTTPTISRTPTAAGQLMYAALATEGPIGDAFTYDSDNTAGAWFVLGRNATTNATAAANACAAGAAKVVTGTSAQTWNSTITSRDIALIGIVFDAQPAAAPGPAVPRLSRRRPALLFR